MIGILRMFKKKWDIKKSAELPNLFRHYPEQLNTYEDISVCIRRGVGTQKKNQFSPRLDLMCLNRPFLTTFDVDVFGSGKPKQASSFDAPRIL